jgi:RNA polymerase sigma factor (sigma-70 family)
MKHESKLKLARRQLMMAAAFGKESPAKIPVNGIQPGHEVVPSLWAVGGCSVSQMPLSELLLAYRKTGDNTMATRLYTEHLHLVLACAMRILDDSSCAEDAAVEVFMKVLERLRIETPRNFGGWLYTVTRNHCFEIRRKTMQSLLLEPLDEKRQWIDRCPDYDTIESHRSHIELAVHRALAELPAHQRCCIELFYIEELSYKEIAEAEGYELGQVKSHIQNGKRRLIALLGPIRNQRFLNQNC